jgi:AraC-like DNA-binding protein
MERPSFDNWTIIFLLFSFLGFTTSILLNFQSKQNRIGRFCISLLLVLFSLTLVDYVLYWTRYQIYFPHFAGISTFFFLLFGPILFLYVESVQERIFNIKNLLHFIPFGIAVVLFIPYLLRSQAEKKHTILNGANESFYPVFFQVVTWFSIAHILYYSIVIFNKRKIFIEFELIKKWVVSLALGLGGIGLSFLTYKILVVFGILTLEWDYMIAFSMVIFISFITGAAFLKPYVFEDHLPQVLNVKTEQKSSAHENPLATANNVDHFTKYKNSPLDKKTGKELAQKLNLLMVENSLWRKNNLRLNDLAAMMQLPKEYISQIINEQFSMNFFEFINRYRIEDAIHLIKNSPDEVTLIEIAYQVGFNNKVSFGKAFRTHSDMSPLEFRRNLKSRAAIL